MKIGVIGCGYFAQFHHEAWSRISDCVVAGVADSDIEKAETELPLTRLFTTGDNYRKVTLHSMKARIQQFESVTNIEMVSGVDEQMIMDIEILDADVTMENANGFQ